MLTAYLVCLVVGGVFVGLSVFAGMKEGGGADKDVGGKDFDKSFDKDVGGKSFEKDFDKSFEKDFELDELPTSHGDAVHEAPTSDVALAGHPGEKRQVPRRRWRYPKGPWLPFASLRFWTFGSCFFGLTGVALTQLAGVGEPVAALASLGVGLAAGTGTAWLVHRLRRPVGAVGSARGWVGVIGELTHPLAPGQLSKVRVRLPGRAPRELLAELADHERALPRDCKVVVLDFRDGRAVVQAADPSMLPGLERPVLEVQPSSVTEEPEEEES